VNILVKQKTKYPVREPNADDAIDLIGILGAAGMDGTAGQAIGVALAAYTSGAGDAATDVVVRAAAEGILSGLSAALRDRATRAEARNFLFNIWNPKIVVKEDDESEDAKKREMWSKLPMDAPLGIAEAFRHTQGFSDFLSFFTDMLPKTSPLNQDQSQTGTPSGAS
jgi:hypothetical protein